MNTDNLKDLFLISFCINILILVLVLIWYSAGTDFILKTVYFQLILIQFYNIKEWT